MEFRWLHHWRGTNSFIESRSVPGTFALTMNQFTIDFNKQALPAEATIETLKRMGATYRERVMG
jgi:hypothetical protein